MRVVATYDNHDGTQSIWLFSIPIDVLIDSLDSSLNGNIANWQEKNEEWRKWWDYGGHEDKRHQKIYKLSQAGKATAWRPWPLQVSGQLIDTYEDVADITIDSGPSMTIWAVGSNGIAKAWRLVSDTVPDQHVVQRRVVAKDGSVRLVDVDGDVEMVDVRDA